MERHHPEVVVVTGASAGVGRATALAFARRGARLGLIARAPSPLEDVAREIERLGGAAVAVPADVADPDAVERAAERVEQAFGPIDIWVNNAMVTVFAPVHALSAEEIRRVTEVTYLGQVHGTLAALRRMRPRNRGVIVQVGSALAYRAIPLQAAYCGAKHAVRGFTDALRSELLHDRSAVRITAVHLPAVNTPQFDWARSRLPRRLQPVPPIFQPELAAEAIVHAARHPRRELFVGWPTVAAITANKLAPGLLDRYLARTNYEAQQTDEPAAPGRPDNLFRPVERLHATHGRFDARARRHSAQLWLTTHRGSVAAALGMALLAGAAVILAGREPGGRRRGRMAPRPSGRRTG